MEFKRNTANLKENEYNYKYETLAGDVYYFSKEGKLLHQEDLNKVGISFNCAVMDCVRCNLKHLNKDKEHSVEGSDNPTALEPKELFVEVVGDYGQKFTYDVHGKFRTVENPRELAKVANECENASYQAGSMDNKAYAACYGLINSIPFLPKMNNLTYSLLMDKKDPKVYADSPEGRLKDADIPPGTKVMIIRPE